MPMENRFGYLPLIIKRQLACDLKSRYSRQIKQRFKQFSSWMIHAGFALHITAGVYPGLVLARFRPARVIKASPTQAATGGLLLCRSLVVEQLAESMGFVFSVSVMYRQTERWLTTNPGFDARGRFLISIKKISQAESFRLRAELLKLPGVTNVNFFSAPPPEEPSLRSLFT